MPLEITVGPPQLVVHDGETVWLSEPDGQHDEADTKGLMFRDTRLISTWNLFANGVAWDLLNGGSIAHFAARIFMANREIEARDGTIPAKTLGLQLDRWADGGIHEDIDIVNYGANTVRFNLELLVRSDFTDVFEVKSGKIIRRGRIQTDWDETEQCLRNTYRNQDFLRAVSITAEADSPAVYANGRLSFDVTLARGERWHACLLYALRDNDELIPAPEGRDARAEDSRAAQSLHAWQEASLWLRSSNEEFYRLFRQAVDDLASLSLPIDGHVVPAAGLPWFLVLFGRDSLIVSLQTLPVTPQFAHGTLAVLGARQSQGTDDYRDAEPGKILHELRRGELAHFNLIPHTPYFGTADATPLYLMLLHETWRWTGDQALIEQHMEVAEGCLSWIDNYGDRDGDGFQEYQTRSRLGYENVAWKDSGDAVLYPDGTMVKGPKALCELQAYVYGGWTGMAEIYDALGKPERAAQLREKAAALFERFNGAFWNEELGFYAYGLDGDKKQVLSVASNVGHCLWTGLIRPDRAQRVVERLMAPDMFSGWGIRTLSDQHVAFNPISYHNGSVWPHDNGLIARGFKRYGFGAEASRVARAVSGAAAFFAGHQVPELYAGLQRMHEDFPVQYLGANVPQAWAAGSAFSFLQAVLGLEPDAANDVLNVMPELPHWLPDVTLKGLKMGRHRFDIRFWHEGSESLFEVLEGDPCAVRLAAPPTPGLMPSDASV
jgi:glycogen debranching enzyme